MYQPLIILCPGRSFSSVVCSMLGQHPQLYGVPELNLFVTETLGDMLDRTARKSRTHHFLHGLVRVIAELEYGSQTEETAELAWQWLESHRDWSTKRVGHYLAELSAPRQLVDKSPTYGSKPEYMQRIHETFPDAYYLHLSRHPRAVASTLYRVYSAKQALSGGNKKGLEDLESHWVEHNRNILEFTEQLPPGQAMRLQGELLLNDPHTYLPQIAEWMGLRGDEAALEAMLHPEDSPYACFGPKNASCGNNLGFLEKPTLRIGGLPNLSLDGDVDWKRDGEGFSSETYEIAHQLGYK